MKKARRKIQAAIPQSTTRVPKFLLETQSSLMAQRFQQEIEGIKDTEHNHICLSQGLGRTLLLGYQSMNLYF
jgi:hypothetical protein